MLKNVLSKVLATACVVALACVALASCAPNSGTAATEEQKAQRAYMSQVHTAMDELGANLELFTDAVSRGDVVNMRTQADNAYKSLDKLNSLEVPSALSEAGVDTKYKDGTAKLRQALDGYIELYTNVQSNESFDRTAYDTRIKELQTLYDDGVKALKEGDEAAANLPK